MLFYNTNSVQCKWNDILRNKRGAIKLKIGIVNTTPAKADRSGKFCILHCLLLLPGIFIPGSIYIRLSIGVTNTVIGLIIEWLALEQTSDHFVSTLFQRAGLPATRSGCTEPHTNWT